VLFRAALLAEQLQIFFRALHVALEPEAEVGAGCVGGGVALRGMAPVQNIRRSVLGDDDVGGAEVTVAELAVLGHSLQAGVQVIAGGGIQIRLRDLAVHLILELGEQGAGLALHLQLQIDEFAQVLVLLVGIFLDELRQRLALDKFGNDGPFAVHGADFQNLRDMKAGLLDTRLIQRLVQHVRLGIVLSENLEHYIGKYQIWSAYDVETKGVMIAYTSVYGNTKKAAQMLCEALKKRGCPKAFTVDLAREDMAEAVEDAFRHEKLVLATTTYNGQYFPFMKHFIEHLVDHNFQKRTVAFIENGTWAPTAAKLMKADLEKCKNLTFCENTVTVRSAVKADTEEAIEKLADELWA